MNPVQRLTSRLSRLPQQLLIDRATIAPRARLDAPGTSSSTARGSEPNPAADYMDLSVVSTGYIAVRTAGSDKSLLSSARQHV